MDIKELRVGKLLHDVLSPNRQVERLCSVRDLKSSCLQLETALMNGLAIAVSV